jgi:hypothetical protein
MSDDLRQRLDRLATELTRDARIPPPEAARRRGRRHRRRQAALGALLVAAVAGVAAGPGAGLLDRPPATVVPSGPPTTVAAVALAAPTVGSGEFAAVIQDPPAGFPARLRGRITGCGPIDMPTFAYPQLVIGEARYQGKWIVLNVAPFPATREPRVELPVPWLSASRVPLDGNGGEDWPRLSAEQPHTRLHLERADGSRGSITGAYRVVRYLDNGSTTTVETVRELAGAQLAMAWDCGRFGR